MLVSSVLVEGVKTQALEFDLCTFVEQVVIPDITANGSRDLCTLHSVVICMLQHRIC